MFLVLWAAARSGLPTKPSKMPFHFESFAAADWEKRWIVTGLENYTGQWAMFDTPEPQSYRGEKMLFATSESAYYALSTKFETPLVLKDKTLIVQYEVRLTKGMECGGAYIKLFGDPDFDPLTLSNETNYLIMFGPDKCGTETNKVHFIFRHANPVNGSIEEKHLTPAPEGKTDKINHLYTLIVRPDHTYEVLIDAQQVKNGSLFEDFTPPVNPPKTIDDPTDRKPATWVDDDMIDDPDAKKPDDWDEDAPEFIPDSERLEPPEDWLVDEPRFIPDPDAKQPDEWDEEILGEWEAPTIANPKCEAAAGCGEYEPPLIENPNYKGKWVPPKIQNPAYQGDWKPRQIPNPEYYEDPDPYGKFPPIVGAGFELWIVSKDAAFGNVYIGTDEKLLRKWNEDHFREKHGRQEHEMKQIEDAEKARDSSGSASPSPSARARPSLHKDGQGVTGAMTDFLLNLKDAWQGMYDDNPEATAVVTLAVAVVPVALFVFSSCCGSPPKRELAPEEKRKRRLRRFRKKREEEAQAKAQAEPKAEGAAGEPAAGESTAPAKEAADDGQGDRGGE
jgi:calnexin